ncbi:hypothetical protein OSTOST_08889, partial [Ostertagia ostertagi]
DESLDPLRQISWCPTFQVGTQCPGSGADHRSPAIVHCTACHLLDAPTSLQRRPAVFRRNSDDDT